MATRRRRRRRHDGGSAETSRPTRAGRSIRSIPSPSRRGWLRRVFAAARSWRSDPPPPGTRRPPAPAAAAAAPPRPTARGRLGALVSSRIVSSRAARGRWPAIAGRHLAWPWPCARAAAARGAAVAARPSPRRRRRPRRPSPRPLRPLPSPRCASRPQRPPRRRPRSPSAPSRVRPDTGWRPPPEPRSAARATPRGRSRRRRPCAWRCGISTPFTIGRTAAALGVRERVAVPGVPVAVTLDRRGLRLHERRRPRRAALTGETPPPAARSLAPAEGLR